MPRGYIETAEACAEWLHQRIREDWGFPDPPEMTMAQRFTSRYRGKRYSFGYPACPALEDQVGIRKLLKLEEIGVQLTEGFMMDPEASASAWYFIIRIAPTFLSIRMMRHDLLRNCRTRPGVTRSVPPDSSLAGSA